MAERPTASRPRGVYIGDGMSTANLLATEMLRPRVDRFVAQHIPVNSYAIGPRVDMQLLGALANQTGGAMAVDGENFTGGKSAIGSPPRCRSRCCGQNP